MVSDGGSSRKRAVECMALAAKASLGERSNILKQRRQPKRTNRRAAANSTRTSRDRQGEAA